MRLALLRWSGTEHAVSPRPARSPSRERSTCYVVEPFVDRGSQNSHPSTAAPANVKWGRVEMSWAPVAAIRGASGSRSGPACWGLFPPSATGPRTPKPAVPWDARPRVPRALEEPPPGRVHKAPAEPGDTHSSCSFWQKLQPSRWIREMELLPRWSWCRAVRP